MKFPGFFFYNFLAGFRAYTIGERCIVIVTCKLFTVDLCSYMILILPIPSIGIFQSYSIFFSHICKTKIAIVNIPSWTWLFFWKKSQYDFLNNDYYLRKFEIWLFTIWVLFFVWRNMTKLHFYAQRIVFTITFF